MCACVVARDGCLHLSGDRRAMWPLRRGLGVPVVSESIRWTRVESRSLEESAVEFVAEVGAELDEEVALGAGGRAFDGAPREDRHLHRAECFPEVEGFGVDRPSSHAFVESRPLGLVRSSLRTSCRPRLNVRRHRPARRLLWSSRFVVSSIRAGWFNAVRPGSGDVRQSCTKTPLLVVNSWCLKRRLERNSIQNRLIVPSFATLDRLALTPPRR